MAFRRLSRRGFFGIWRPFGPLWRPLDEIWEPLGALGGSIWGPVGLRLVSFWEQNLDNGPGVPKDDVQE